jgi:hypothetical protein
MIRWDPPRPRDLSPRLVREVARRYGPVMKRARRDTGAYPRDLLVRWTAVGSGQQLVALEPVP